MLLFGRISIGEMSFYPMTQLSIVEIMVIPRVYRIDGHRYDERLVARLRRSGRVSVAFLGVDVIQLGRNPRTYPLSVYGKHLRTDFDNVMIPST